MSPTNKEFPPSSHVLWLTDNQDMVKRAVGTGWESELGVRIVLDPGVVLDWRTCREYYISLVPRRGSSED